MVRSQGEPYSVYRRALSDQIQEARGYGLNYPWKVKVYKKRLNNKNPDIVHPDWADLTRDKFQYSRVARSLWTEAIVRQPQQFIHFTITTIGIALSRSLVNPRFELSKFWETQWLATKRRWAEEPLYFKRVFGVNLQQFSLIRQRGASRIYLLDSITKFVNRHLNWVGRMPEGGGWRNGDPIPSLVPRPMGILALTGMITGLTMSSKRLKCLILLIPFSMYLFGTYAVGDAVARYLQPVEWIGMVFAGVLLDLILQAASAVYDLSRRWLSPLS